MSSAGRGPTQTGRGYLLDNSVISALAPGREAHFPANFEAWLEARNEWLFLPCIAVADLAIVQGQRPGFPDVAIAALTRQAGLVLLTRNLKHFQPLGVDCVNPHAQLPEG